MTALPPTLVSGIPVSDYLYIYYYSKVKIVFWNISRTGSFQIASAKCEFC